MQMEDTIRKDEVTDRLRKLHKEELHVFSGKHYYSDNWDEVTDRLRKLHKEELHNVFSGKHYYSDNWEIYTKF